MDKRELTEIITDIFKTLPAQKTSVFKKNDEVVEIRVVSKAFAGMTYTDRFKKLDQMLKDAQMPAYGDFLFIYEAFTPGELLSLPKSNEEGKTEDSNDSFKHTAKDVDLT